MKERILILGAGVIGSIYAAKFSSVGFDVTMCARSNRLKELNSKGLLYFENGVVKKADVKVVPHIQEDIKYDFIFVAVRYNQVEDALYDIRNNRCKNIVTMVKNPNSYGKWENILGGNKIIAAFPGAGGKIENGILYYKITSKMVRPTTFGESDGKKTDRIKRLARVFSKSRVTYSISCNMTAWQKNHIALVTPLANGIYFDGGNNYTTSRNKIAIKNISLSLRENFNSLVKAGIPITPYKLNIFRYCPICIMNLILKMIYNTKFGEDIIYSHSLNHKSEMVILIREFIGIMERNNIELKYFRSVKG